MLTYGTELPLPHPSAKLYFEISLTEYTDVSCCLPYDSSHVVTDNAVILPVHYSKSNMNRVMSPALLKVAKFSKSIS